MRHHLQVEIPGTQALPRQGAQLDKDFFMKAQGPTFMTKDKATILSLRKREREKRRKGSQIVILRNTGTYIRAVLNLQPFI